jgi:hypothetical protein
MPQEPVYYYNIATIYEKLDKKDKLAESLDWIITVYKNKDYKTEKINLQYLDYARKIFSKLNEPEKVNEIDEIINSAKKYPQNLELII